MTIATALLLTVLGGGAPQVPAALPTSTDQAPAKTSERRLVVEPEEPAVRQRQAPQAPGGGTLQAPASDHAYSLDSRHRLEVRFGGWGDGWYEGHGDNWHAAGSARGAFGLEYLHFIRNDLGIGVGLSSLVHADDCHDCLDGGAAQVVTSVPVIVRWYPIRRLSRSRHVEPYVTGGIGPVFGIDTLYTHIEEGGHWRHDEYYSTRVGTAIGGRAGAGVDFRLGRIFSIGVGGAYNWDSGFKGDLWRAPRPSGGEFTVSFGWNFGR